MSVFRWRFLSTKHFGRQPSFLVHAELQRADGQFQPIALELDTGFLVSLLRRSAAELLGLGLEDGKRVEVRD